MKPKFGKTRLVKIRCVFAIPRVICIPKGESPYKFYYYYQWFHETGGPHFGLLADPKSESIPEKFQQEHLEHTSQRFARHAHVILTTLWLITYRK